ncbi:MAG TPA: DUF1289 domain-containing protein [Solirubrobacteraceae bacterium]|nr:DUF1289 domain-containing protein [Solirubrobacteraceae bacterium]
MSARGEADRRRVESPCVGVCVIDETSGLCEGCLRTLEEIARWGVSSAPERREVLAAVAARRAAMGAGAPPARE